jgi:hypothetical protein
MVVLRGGGMVGWAFRGPLCWADLRRGSPAGGRPSIVCAEPMESVW